MPALYGSAGMPTSLHRQNIAVKKHEKVEKEGENGHI